MSSESDAQPPAVTNGPSAVPDAAPASASEPTTDVAAPPATDAPSSADVEPIESTSEANITATDPNVEPAQASTAADDKPTTTDGELDMKAADVAEGAESGAAVVAPGSSEDVKPITSSPKKGATAKRKSTGAVPEHRSKKLSKKKSVPVLHLDAEPGQYYFARLKGHAPWPAIVCDEDMLPEQLLATRPVTAKRPDGSYREDFLEGGKNAKDRTYPVMFLATNEFAWLPNVDLSELDPEKIKDEQQGKKSKRLHEAYQIAAEQHDLAYFKKILSEFETERQKAEAEYAAKERELAEKEAKRAEKAAEKSAKKETKAKRKSKAADNEDVEMNDADAPKSASKKRKKSSAGDEGDETKPVKTPKTLKVNLSKAANGDSAKSKSKASKAKDSPKEPEMTEEERIEKRQKSVLFLRHKLQKGLLQDKAPDEAEMATMAKHFEELEKYRALEVNIIRGTKIHKVLKAILKLDSLPMDDKYKFKERSHALLQEWTKILDANTSGSKEGDGANGSGGQEKPNGEATEDAKPDEAQADKEGSEEASKPAESASEDARPEATEPKTEAKADEPAAGSTETPPAAPTDAKVDAPSAPGVETKIDEDADVSMTDAKDAAASTSENPEPSVKTGPIPVEAEGNIMDSY